MESPNDSNLNTPTDNSISANIKEENPYTLDESTLSLFNKSNTEECINVMVAVPWNSLDISTDPLFITNLPIKMITAKNTDKKKIKTAHPRNISSIVSTGTDEMNNVIPNSPAKNVHSKVKKPILNLKTTANNSNITESTTDAAKNQPVQQLNIFIDQNDNLKTSKCNTTSKHPSVEQNVILLSDVSEEESIDDLFSSLENISEEELKTVTDVERENNTTVLGTRQEIPNSTNINTTALECITISSDEDEAIFTSHNVIRRSEILELFGNYQIKSEKVEEECEQVSVFKECFIDLSKDSTYFEHLIDTAFKNNPSETDVKDNKTDANAKNQRTDIDTRNNKTTADVIHDQTNTDAINNISDTDTNNTITDLNVKNKITKNTNLKTKTFNTNKNTVTANHTKTDTLNKQPVLVSVEEDTLDQTTVELVQIDKNIEKPTSIKLVQINECKSSTKNMLLKIKGRIRSKSVEISRPKMSDNSSKESPITFKDLEFLDLYISGGSDISDDIFWYISREKPEPDSAEKKMAVQKLQEDILDLVPKINLIYSDSKMKQSNENQDLLSGSTQESDKENQSNVEEGAIAAKDNEPSIHLNTGENKEIAAKNNEPRNFPIIDLNTGEDGEIEAKDNEPCYTPANCSNLVSTIDDSNEIEKNISTLKDHEDDGHKEKEKHPLKVVLKRIHHDDKNPNAKIPKFSNANLSIIYSIKQEKMTDKDDAYKDNDADNNNDSLYAIAAGPKRSKPQSSYYPVQYTDSSSYEESYSHKKRKPSNKCHKKKRSKLKRLHQEVKPIQRISDEIHINELCTLYATKQNCPKKDHCEYMHKDFPCKHYYLGITGANHDNETCLYTHGKPLTPELRQILLSHLENGPSEILGNFPRFSVQQFSSLLNARHKILERKFEKELSEQNEQNQNTESTEIRLECLTDILTKELIDKLAEFDVDTLEQINYLTLSQLHQVGLNVLQIYEIQKRAFGDANASDYFTANQKGYDMRLMTGSIRPPVSTDDIESSHDERTLTNRKKKQSPDPMSKLSFSILHHIDVPPNTAYYVAIHNDDKKENEKEINGEEIDCNETGKLTFAKGVTAKANNKFNENVKYKETRTTENSVVEIQDIEDAAMNLEIPTVLDMEQERNLNLPFSPTKKLFVVATEINASLALNPSIEWKAIRIEMELRNCSEMIKHVSPNNDIVDPRIRKLLGMEPLHQKRALINTEDIGRKFDRHDDDKSVDPRMERSVFKEKFRAVDLFDQQTANFNIQCMLQNSMWYRDLGSNQKIQVNQQLAQLSNELKRFNEDPMPGKVFHSQFFQRSILLQQLFSDLKIAIDVNGKFVQLAASSAATNRDDQLSQFMGADGTGVGSMFGMENMMSLYNPTNLTSIKRTVYNTNAANVANVTNVGSVANVVQPAAIIPSTAPVLLNLLGNQGFFVDQMNNLSQMAYQLNGSNFMVPNMFASMNLNTFNVGNNVPTTSTEPQPGNDNSDQNPSIDSNKKSDSNQSNNWNNNKQQSNENDYQQDNGRSFGDRRNQRNPFKPSWQSRQGGNNNSSWNKNGNSNSRNWNDDSQKDQQSNGWNSARNNKPNWNKPKFRDWDNSEKDSVNKDDPTDNPIIDWGQIRNDTSAKISKDANKNEEPPNTTWDSPVKDNRKILSHTKDWDDAPDDLNNPTERTTDWDNPKKSHNSNYNNKLDEPPVKDVQPSTSGSSMTQRAPSKHVEIECEENWDDE